MAKPTSVHVVTATEAQSKFGEIIKRAYASDEHLIVEKSGIPVVAIIPIAVYRECVSAPGASPEIEQKVATASERAAAAKDLQAFLAQVHAKMPNVPEEEVDRDIEAAVREVRQTRARRSPTATRPARATHGPRSARRKT